MRIYNYGNDYAFQQKQKSKEAEQKNANPVERQSVEPVMKTETDVENQIHGRREGAAADESQSNESKQAQESRKKKKETRS